MVPYLIPGLALWKARESIFNYFAPMIAGKRNSEDSDIFSRLCQVKDEDGQDFNDEAILYYLSKLLAEARDAFRRGCGAAFTIEHANSEALVVVQEVSKQTDCSEDELQALAQAALAEVDALKRGRRVCSSVMRAASV